MTNPFVSTLSRVKEIRNQSIVSVSFTCLKVCNSFTSCMFCALCVNTVVEEPSPSNGILYTYTLPRVTSFAFNSTLSFTLEEIMLILSSFSGTVTPSDFITQPN